MSNDNVVSLLGRFGNQLWEISAGIKLFGEDNFKVNLSYCGEFELKAFNEGFCKPEVKNKESMAAGDYALAISYYQHRKFLAEPFQVRHYLKEKPKDIAQLPCVCHLRLDDYMTKEPYNKCIITKEFFEYNLKQFGVDKKDVWVLTDGTEEQVKTRLQDDNINVFNEPDMMRAFWTMQSSENLICSASSFSYWAGYLKERGKVVLPPIWPCDFSNDTAYGTMATDSKKELFWWT